MIMGSKYFKHRFNHNGIAKQISGNKEWWDLSRERKQKVSRNDFKTRKYVPLLLYQFPVVWELTTNKQKKHSDDKTKVRNLISLCSENLRSSDISTTRKQVTWSPHSCLSPPHARASRRIFKLGIILRLSRGSSSSVLVVSEIVILASWSSE